MRGKETMMKTREEMEKKMLCKRIDFFANREEICNALVGIKSGTEICKFYKDKKQYEQERSKILKKGACCRSGIPTKPFGKACKKGSFKFRYLSD